MSELSVAFKSAVHKWLQDTEAGKKNGVSEVLTWEGKQAGGYCDSCYFEYTTVNIKYRTSDDTVKTYEYYGSFAELLEDLLSQEEK